MLAARRRGSTGESCSTRGRRPRWPPGFSTAPRVAPQARQAGVHSEGERKTARTRECCRRREDASSPGGRCAGTRVGGPVRIQIVWISAGPRLPGRDAGDLRDRTRRVVSAPVGAGRGPGRRIGCGATLLLSLIVMIKTVLPGWVGAGYAGLFGVRCGRARL